MKKDAYWSIEKLIPRVGTSAFSVEKKADGIPLSSLSVADEPSHFGKPFVPRASRVIRQYRLTEITLPKTELMGFGQSDEKALPFVPCTQFSPSFFSLNEKQKRYFFHFCKKVKAQKKVPTSFPYLQLFLCRLIRSACPAEEIFDDYFFVWKTYRSEYPLLDKLCADTMSDYCFGRGIVPPYARLGEIFSLPDFSTRPFLLNTYIFDYLLQESHTLSPMEQNLILRFLTGESFRKTKAYRMHGLYPSAVEDAVSRAMRCGLFNRRDLNQSLFRIQIPSEVRAERKLFQGLPIAEVPSGEISIRYLPLLHDENIRSRFDEIIRYLENRVRKILKIKNCLSRIHISSEHQVFLEGILASYEHLKPQTQTEDEKDEIAVPIPRELHVDFDAAAKIEEDSWGITQSLTEAYTHGDDESVVIGGENDKQFDTFYQNELKALESAVPCDDGEFWEFAGALSETEDLFMRIAVNEGTVAARRYSATVGTFFEAMLASCNEKATDACGDAVFNGLGEIYPDYLDALKTVFPPMEGENNGAE